MSSQSVAKAVLRQVLREVDAPLVVGVDHWAALRKLSLISVTRDARGVAEQLTQLMQKGGLRACLTEPGEVAEGSDGLILLEGLDPLSTREALARGRRAFVAAQKVAQKLSGGFGLFVTVQDTGGCFGLEGSSGCWGAGLSGLAKTARLEWPQAQVKALDLEAGNRDVEALARALLRELTQGGSEAEVGLRADQRRTTLAMNEAKLGGSAAATAGARILAQSAVSSSSVILATGGARGVTAACLIELARQFKPRAFILCGRTALEPEPACCADVQGDAALKQALMADALARGEALSPRALNSRVEAVVRNREIIETLAALNEAGSQAEYLAADICDAHRLREALAPCVNKWGPITGVVHGAGVLADKRIADKSVEQFEAVFKTKVVGLEQVLEATSGAPLSLLCLFSSVAARSGNLGQSDYSMANEVLNKVAHQESKARQGKCLVKSFNWGPWEGGMVTPELSRHFQSLGVSLIPLQGGAEAFVNEIGHGDAREIEVVFGSPEISAEATHAGSA